MVFQHFELYPHLSVLNNITLAPIQVKGLSKKDANFNAMKLLERVGIDDQANKYPAELSEVNNNELYFSSFSFRAKVNAFR